MVLNQISLCITSEVVDHYWRTVTQCNPMYCIVGQLCVTNKFRRIFVRFARCSVVQSMIFEKWVGMRNVTFFNNQYKFIIVLRKTLINILLQVIIWVSLVHICLQVVDMPTFSLSGSRGSRKLRVVASPSGTTLPSLMAPSRYYSISTHNLSCQ